MHGPGESDDLGGLAAPASRAPGAPGTGFDPDELSGNLLGLYRYALTLTDSPEDAEDLVSATVVRALERRDSFTGRSGLASWLHSIMHNLAVDQFRRRREQPQDPEDLAMAVERRWQQDEYTVNAEVVALRSQDTEELREALLRVPATHRSALVMHDMLGMTGREISEAQDVTVPAAKQRIRRGRMMLVSALAAGTERRAALQGVPLDCWSARSRVDEYLDDEIDDGTRAALVAHLSGCPTCPPLLRGIVSARSAVAEFQDDDSVLPEALAEKVRAVSGSDR